MFFFVPDVHVFCACQTLTLSATLCMFKQQRLQDEQEGGVLPVPDAGRGGHEGESVVRDDIYTKYLF